MASFCPGCGHRVNVEDRFCSSCGVPLTPARGKPTFSRGIDAESAANIWGKIFRPFFKTAFIFFGFFFGFALLLMIVWYFMFRH